MPKNQENSKNNKENEPQEIEVILPEESITPTHDMPKAFGFLQNQKTLRIGMWVILLLVAVLGAWGIGSLIVHATAVPLELTPTATASIAPTPENLAAPTFSTENQPDGVVRLPEVIPATAEVEPTLESAPRDDVIVYTVEEGDSIFAIADKFGLKPETVLWSNRLTLGDTPDGIYPGDQLYIIPVDGTYHRWSEGEGMNGVANGYGVTVDDIIDYPLNNLDRATLGNLSLPNIEPGTWLVIPGGSLPSLSWVPARDSEVSGSIYLGNGACTVLYGNSGTGTFTWPTTNHLLSGYDYTPPTHNGLDFDGDMGSPIYAVDSGVIVYSGWSDRGYGNLIVVDHDNGWQSFYAHLMDGSLLPCGTNVVKGEWIASMGSTGNSTGPHLHFELRSYGAAVNPWAYLQ